jgi:hypothetical protein
MIDLKITQQFGQIGLEINPAKYDLNIQSPDIQVKQTPADIDLKQSPGDLEIDYTAARESLGFGGVWYLINNMVQEAHQAYAGNLEKIVADGRDLGEIEKHISIGQVAGKHFVAEPRDLELAAIQPLDIRYQPQAQTCAVNLGGVSVGADWGRVGVDNFIFPSVRVFLEREPYLKIEAVGQVIDQNK